MEEAEAGAGAAAGSRSAPASTKGTVAAGGQAGSSAGGGGEEKQTLMDLAEAEQRVIANLKTASQLMQSLHGRLSGGSGEADVQSLSKSYVEGVQKVQQLLSGMDEMLAYRHIDRTTYGPHLDLAVTADAVTHVHSQLTDLKAYLGAAVERETKSDGGNQDVEMADTK